MNTLSVINLMPSTKAEIKTFTEKVIDAVNNGEIPALQLDIQLKRIETVCDTIRKATKGLVIDEAQAYGKVFDYAGAEITISERKTADYSTDPEWVKLNEQIKAREAVLKTIQEGCTLVDEETGEVYNAPLFKRTDVISYKIK